MVEDIENGINNLAERVVSETDEAKIIKLVRYWKAFREVLGYLKATPEDLEEKIEELYR